LKLKRKKLQVQHSISFASYKSALLILYL